MLVRNDELYPLKAALARTPNHPSIGGGCDTSDEASGAWPFKGEPLPKQDGGCADLFASNAAESVSNPEAQLELGGPFNLFCGWSTYVVIRFNDRDLVKAIQINKASATCV